MNETLATVDPILARCREIYVSRESEIGSYPGDQKDYDKGWLNRLDKIMQYIENGDRNIHEILARLRNFWMSGRWEVGEYADFRTGDQTTRLLARSAYVYYRNAVADAVSAEGTKDTRAIFDLGSGNGEQIFWIWAEARLRGRRFYACEFSEAGRRTTRLLASLDPKLKLTTKFFDYRAPDLTSLATKDGHAIVYSTHSIEQVDQLPAVLIEQLLDLAPAVTGLHFEPIGWQFAPDQDDPHVAAHRARCLEFNYNQNFWSLLKDYQSRGKLKIRTAEPYFAGFAYNPPCKIIWEKI
jgi:hypothetical protein